MSVLNKFTEADGIEAACGGTRNALDFSFTVGSPDEVRRRYKEIFIKMVEILEIEEGQNEFKATLDAKSLLLRRSGTTYVGVIAIKGHPVVKSLQRMVRKTFRKLGARVPETKSRTPAAAQLRPAVPTPTSTAPTRPIDVSSPSSPNNGDKGPTRPF
jgi:hypothetical protein